MDPSADSDSGNPENQVVAWINRLDFVGAQDKVTLLRQVQEMLVHQCPHAIPMYIHDVLCYVNDKNSEVRKCLVAFIEEISKVRIELLPLMAPNLQILLMDTVVAVQKRVIQAANIIYKNAYIWMCKGSGLESEMQKAWEVLNHMKLTILNLIDCENEGIRTNSIKFLEGIIILQTYRENSYDSRAADCSLDDLPDRLPFIQKKKLEEESSHIFDLLVKFHNSQHISGVNLMACMSALCEVAKFRSQFLSKVIQAFSSLNGSLPPTLSQSQTNSVKKHLKMQLINLVKHPSCADSLAPLIQVLSNLGMTAQEIAKVMPKGERKIKRINEIIRNGEGIKRARIDSPQSNSQSSDKSDLEPEIEVTEKSILEGLQNIDSIVNLLMASMKNLPDEFPPYFKALYEPISNSGVVVQHSSLAKLLMRLINPEKHESTIPNIQPSQPVDEEKIKLKNALAKLENSKLESKIEGVLSKLIDSNKGEESARDKEIFSNFEKEKLKEKEVCPPTPTIPKLLQRVKTIKLHEVTKPLSQNVRERIILGAVERILKAERNIRDINALNCRMKMLATFAVSYGDQVRETILAFILDDVPGRIDLALSWMYEEYCYMQGFSRKIASTSNTSKIDEKSYQSYNNLLCAIITDLMELNDPSQDILREELFRRIYLEAPMVTNDAIIYLKQLGQDEEKHLVGLNLLRDLMIYQPTKATKFITALLPITIICKNPVIREAAIERLAELYSYQNESLRKAIDKHTSLHLGFIGLPHPPQDIWNFEQENPPMNAWEWDDNLYKLCLQPYLAILPYNHQLLHELCRIYIKIGPDGKRCVLRLLEAPIKQMGADNPTLLSVIEECPKGAETLITRIIHILTEKTSPSPELVAKVRDLYIKRVPDVRFLIPVLTGLTKSEILGALPKLIKLNQAVVREAFNKLWTCHDNPPLTPADLLVALHVLDSTKIELKYVIKATSLCFAEKQAYTCEVLADVLQELVDQPQLPVLLMRSVLQALTVYPARLSSHVINILHQLITKMVWEQKVVWEGFLICCQRLSPQSLTVLIMLPKEPLRLALIACPDLHTTLAEAVPNMSNVPHHVSTVLTDLQYADTSNGIPSMKNDLMDSTMDLIPGNEPLPPGMD